jgi:putative RecB family exonuclease
LIIHYLSASRIKTYLQCPNKYYEQYENGVRGSAIHLVFGTLMHTVFERWFQEDKDLVQLYEEEWNKAEIVEPEFFRDGYEIIENFRAMSNREECTPIGFEQPFAIDIVSGFVYNTNEVDFEDKSQVKAFLKTLEDQETAIIFGFIDRIDYDMDNDYLRIIDYKTSRIPLTQAEADEDVQLSMYALVAKYLFPEYKRVKLELHYVREGSVVMTSRTDDQLSIFSKWLMGIYYKIKNDTTHEAILNKYCGWCDSKDNCVAYQELISGETLEEFSVFEQMSPEEIDEQLDQVSIYLKILDGRKKDIQKYLKDKLKRSDNTPINMGKSQMYLSTNSRTSYSPRTIMELFPNDYDELLTVSKEKVDTRVKGNSDLMAELERSANKYYIEPTLRKKKSN